MISEVNRKLDELERENAQLREMADGFKQKLQTCVEKHRAMGAKLREAERLLEKASKHLLSTEGATEILEFLEDNK